ncbi:hypothetical protein [Streptomyces sioyaensis]|uniref:hypothetical protein n=1 Tax=Streptomyces sioyaensis TaxID=67364 RepID=UPI0037B08472
MVSNNVKVKSNVLLRGTEHTLPLNMATLLRRVAESAETPKGKMIPNLRHVTERQLNRVFSMYGPEGLYRLLFMATTNPTGEFLHFFRIMALELSPVTDTLLRLTSKRQGGSGFKWDNGELPEGDDLAKISSNLLQPSLSRKLYNPGTHRGYVTYGLGGPRMLISHPFQGINGEVYGVYENSSDVATSLLARGYRGSFLFLDYLPGLNYDMMGIPAWAVWFSIIAAHSDAVLFIKEYDGEFEEAQKLEIALTPNRVQKKIVEIPEGELTWAAKPEVGEIDYYVLGTGNSSKEAWYEMEAEHAKPLVEAYMSTDTPRDRLIRMDESGDVTYFPLNFPIYRNLPH